MRKEKGKRKEEEEKKKKTWRLLVFFSPFLSNQIHINYKKDNNDIKC